MSYYDEFYNEPSEFDQQIEEFKQSLLLKVKEEYKTEMELLRKENADLQNFNRDKQNIEREIQTMHHKFEREKEEAHIKAKRARLAELMGGFETEMWTPEYYCMDSRKCDRCDNNRKIQYKTPLGRDATEICTCSGNITVYHPAKNILHKISTRSDWGTIKNTWLYYSLKNDGDYESAEFRSSDSAEKLFVPDATTFEEVEKFHYKRCYFENYDDCYRFCMWKMEKDAGILPQSIVSTESTQADKEV